MQLPAEWESSGHPSSCTEEFKQKRWHGIFLCMHLQAFLLLRRFSEQTDERTRARNARTISKQKAGRRLRCGGWCGESERSGVSKRNEGARRSQMRAGI